MQHDKQNKDKLTGWKIAPMHKQLFVYYKETRK
jgi:hypothetical protein